MNRNIIFTLLTGMLIVFSCQQKSEVRNTHELLHAVLWMQRSAEYKAACLQAYHLAEMQLQAALTDKNWTAALEQYGDYTNLPSAVIVDVDETVLDNSPYEARLIREVKNYSSESWEDWCNEARAEAVPGALEFCKSADEQGITVFYVTNRREKLRNVTRKNLEKLGFPLEENIETVLARLESSDKGSRRSIISEDYRILLLIGDNLGDFASGFTHAPMNTRDSLLTAYHDNFGKKWIVLPNPIYGDWEGALYNYNYNLSDVQKLHIKKDVLISD